MLEKIEEFFTTVATILVLLGTCLFFTVILRVGLWILCFLIALFHGDNVFTDWVYEHWSFTWVICFLGSILMWIGGIFGTAGSSAVPTESSGQASRNCSEDDGHDSRNEQIIRKNFIYMDCSGNYRRWGEPFIDHKGNWCNWGSGFYDYDDNYIYWGDSYKDSNGAYRRWGDDFYDADGNYIRVP